jgi:hypothetical protein
VSSSLEAFTAGMLVWNHYHRYWTVGLVFLFVLVVVFFQSRSLAGPVSSKLFSIVVRGQ